jgi:hypothetical protein
MAVLWGVGSPAGDPMAGGEVRSERVSARAEQLLGVDGFLSQNGERLADLLGGE